MSTKEIHDMIQNIDGSTPPHELGRIMEQLNDKIAELEMRLNKAEGTARHANNIASCLANGIQPD